MGVSMYAVSKIGQKGLPPNPQMSMMVYAMPVMMTVLFARFPAGLNLTMRCRTWPACRSSGC